MVARQGGAIRSTCRLRLCAQGVMEHTGAAQGRCPVQQAQLGQRGARSGGWMGAGSAQGSTSKAALTLIESEQGLPRRDLCCRAARHVLHISEIVCRKRLRRWGRNIFFKKMYIYVLGIEALLKVVFLSPIGAVTLLTENCSVCT